jgi:hypothetical protein
MKTANEQGTLVLLQNLDPVYTSAEVEVLLILELWFFIGYIILFGIMMVVGTVINVGKRNIHLQCKSLSLQETFFFSRSYIFSKINCCVFLIVPSF